MLSFLVVRACALIMTCLLAYPLLSGCARAIYNAKIVSDDPVLVRSAYPTEAFLKKLNQSLQNDGGLKLIINLTCKTSEEEERFALQNKTAVIKMCWSARKKPPDKEIEYLIEVFKNKENYPMLIHCKAGADRTGLATALWRIEMGGVSPEEALSEMKWFMNIYLWFPEMQETVIKRYSVPRGRLWALTVYYFVRDTLLLPKYAVDNVLQELEFLQQRSSE